MADHKIGSIGSHGTGALEKHARRQKSTKDFIVYDFSLLIFINKSSQFYLQSTPFCFFKAFLFLQMKQSAATDLHSGRASAQLLDLVSSEDGHHASSVFISVALGDGQLTAAVHHLV